VSLLRLGPDCRSERSLRLVSAIATVYRKRLFRFKKTPARTTMQYATSNVYLSRPADLPVSWGA